MLRSILKKIGYSISQYPPQSTQDFIKLLKSHNIDLVLDVGANTGQFGKWLIDFGYCGKILSFEPMQKEYDILVKNSKKNKNWLVAEKCALSNVNGEQEFNISENSVSSSFLPLTDYVKQVSPSTKYVAKEKVKTLRLENYDLNNTIRDARSVFLKLDVQGFEDPVLDGAAGILNNIKGMLIEFSLMPLYEGQKSMIDLLKKIDSLGYESHYFIPHVTSDKTGRLLQVDGVFFKKGKI